MRVTPFLEKKPSSRRYYQEGVPEAIDIANWRLTIDGLVDQKLSLTYREIMDMPQVHQDRRVVCVCNWSIRRLWSGVLLAEVMNLAHPFEGRLWLKQRSVGGPKGNYESTIGLDQALERQALLCHSVDRKPLSLEQGFPLRLIDFSLYGYKSVKGLTKLEVTRERELGYWEKKAGYPFDGTIQPKQYWIVDLQQHRFCHRHGEVTEF